MGVQESISKLGGQQAVMEQVQRLFGGNGVQGVVSKLTSAGLGQQVQSWTGKGPDQPISGQQLRQAMDPGALQQVSQQTSTPPEQVCDHVAQVLPHIIKQANPTGESAASSAMSRGMEAVRNMFNR